MLLRRISVLAVLMLTLGSAAAIALPDMSPNQTVAQSQKGPGRGQGGPGKEWIEQLKLTPEQQQKIEQIRTQSKPQFDQLREKMRQVHQELEQLMIGTASDNDIRAKHRQVLELKQQMAELRFEQMLAMRAVLTPEQRQQWATLMQQRKQKFENRQGNKAGQNAGDRGNSM